MRRRAVVPSVADGEAPPELRVGRLVEVWAHEGLDHFTTVRRFKAARRKWSDSLGLSDVEAAKRIGRPGDTTWSITFLEHRGRGDLADEFLRLARVSRADLPALHEAAQAWIEPGECAPFRWQDHLRE